MITLRKTDLSLPARGSSRVSRETGAAVPRNSRGALGRYVEEEIRPSPGLGVDASSGSLNNPPGPGTHLLKTSEHHDQDHCYPATVQVPYARCDRNLRRHERERTCRTNSTRMPAGLRWPIPVGRPTERREPGRRTSQPIAPRLVCKKEAASYCRMGVEYFTRHCPVAPVRVGPGMRGLRYDLHDLDEWIDSLKQSSRSTESNKNWLDRVGNDKSAEGKGS